MFNYANLSDVEFEYLVRDIMQKRLGIELHRFGSGRDGGIDLVDDAFHKRCIVQVKHYVKTDFSGLFASLKKEVEKINHHKPEQYYVVCSCTLTPQNTENIYSLFSDYMDSTHNILSIIDIDDFLQLEPNKEIVSRHFKLWLESTRVLSEISSRDIFVDSQVLLSKIQENRQLFVETESYRHALKCLSEKRVLLLIGPPGVGKTVTSEMLVLHFAAKGYSIRYTTDGESLSALKKALTNNPSQKEIVLLDDCLGQYYFKMKDTQENELLSLVRYTLLAPNKILLLNSRVTIYKEAQDRSIDFFKEVENGKLKVNIIDMSSISLLERAKIFYNHLYFSKLPKEYFNDIKKDKNYLKIIRHPNYSPRIMEYVTMNNIQNKITPDKYFFFIKNALDQPNNIWANEYNRHLQPVDRMLLTTLYSLTDTLVEKSMLVRCFNHRLTQTDAIDRTINNFLLALSRLNESFLSVVSVHGLQKIGVINPSVNDFLDNCIIEGSTEKDELKKSIISVRQAYRILNKKDADELMHQKILDNSIFDFEFESEKVKKDYILYYIITKNVKKDCYQQVISDFLMNPHDVFHYDENYTPKIRIVLSLLKNDICEYYKVVDYIFNNSNLDKLLSDNDLNDLIELIGALEPLVVKKNIRREEYLTVISPNLLDAVEYYCTDIDAAEVSDEIDINAILNNNNDYNGIDQGAATNDLEESIISSVQEDLSNCLSELPTDIAELINEDEIDFSVDGADSVITSYLEPDEDEYEGHGLSNATGYDEIEYIFER